MTERSTETFIQWRRRLEAEHGYKGLTFMIEERNGKTEAAKVFSAMQTLGEWPAAHTK